MLSNEWAADGTPGLDSALLMALLGKLQTNSPVSCLGAATAPAAAALPYSLTGVQPVVATRSQVPLLQPSCSAAQLLAMAHKTTFAPSCQQPSSAPGAATSPAVLALLSKLTQVQSAQNHLKIQQQVCVHNVGFCVLGAGTVCVLCVCHPSPSSR